MYVCVYQGRINYWIGWWINFQRKVQRVYTKKGTHQYNAKSRYILAWRRFRTAWNKIFKRRVTYWYSPPYPKSLALHPKPRTLNSPPNPEP